MTKKLEKRHSNTTLGYSIPQHSVSTEIQIKRSRFIAEIAHAEDKVSAETFIRQTKQRFPDARHHCWAYIACPPQSALAVRFSDDGEPQGTAGKPILNVLQYSGIGEIVCVVSRYFGGIKLGAGGLIRAYSNSAKTALDMLRVEQKIPRAIYQIQCDYSLEADVRYLTQLAQGQIQNIEYTQQIQMRVNVPLQGSNDFLGQVQALSMRVGKVVEIISD